MTAQGNDAGRGNAVAIQLPKKLTSSVCVQIQAELMAEKSKNIRIDAGEVEFVGALAAQLLFTAQCQWHNDGAEWAFDPVSGAFRQGLELLGMAAMLNVNDEVAL